MILDKKLFQISSFEFNTRHLLIIVVLSLSFSISAILRSYPAEYGFQLNEFDPFFNYRATHYLVDHGLNAYVHWHDNMSWYPHGRDVFATSQAMLHITAAFLYKAFGTGTSLYDFTIIFPVIFGSLTTIVVFALVRVIGGTTAGLFASLFFAVSPSIISRGTIGWFKSEPLGLFFGLLSLYLLLSGIQSRNYKIALSKMVGGGLLLSFGLASWGGDQFFIIPLAIFFVILPLIRRDHNFLVTTVPIFAIITLLTSLLFERPGIHFVTGLGGVAFAGSIVILLSLVLVRKFGGNNFRRNSLLVLLFWVVIGIVILESNTVSLPYERYLAAVNPFLISENSLVLSIQEHELQPTGLIFFSSSVFLIFAGFGAWFLMDKLWTKSDISTFDQKREQIAFVLILGLTSAYVGTTLLRLGVFTEIGVLALAAIGLSIIFSGVMKIKPAIKKKGLPPRPIEKPVIIGFIGGMVLIISGPLFLPVDFNWVTVQNNPPMILNGNTQLVISTNDWLVALDWLKNNTPKDSVVVSWWDYGYWIETLGDRKTIADGATFDYPSIPQTAKIFLSSPDTGWKILNDLKADYVLVFVAGDKFTVGQKNYYVLGVGDDINKVKSMAAVAEFNPVDFLDNSGLDPTDNFWHNTLLGSLIPFTPHKFDSDTNGVPSKTPQGYGVYEKKTIFENDDNTPLKPVYHSPGLDSQKDGPFLAVLLYQVNHNYKPVTSSS